MHVLPAHHQVDDGDGQNDEEEDQCRRAGVGRIPARIAVEHVIHVTHDGVHAGHVQVRAEDGDLIRVRLEGPDEARDDQIEDHGGDHGEGDAPEDAALRGAVDLRGIVIILLDRSERAGQDQDLEGHDHPDGVQAHHQHLGPVGSVDEVDRLAAEGVDEEVDHAVGIGGLFKQDHEHEADGQRVRDVRQKIDGLVELPQGLDTVIAERGGGLSEGQVQRIAIARAILSGAPVLLLDEATSALDEATEAQLLKNLREMKDVTCIIISHKKAAEQITRAKSQGKKIVAVGTTTVRTLETVYNKYGCVKACHNSSELFIYPPYEFKVIDNLITNFHLPKSTLLMLVSALAGKDFIFEAYKEAIENKYRFFSYGDCMYIK